MSVFSRKIKASHLTPVIGFLTTSFLLAFLFSIALPMQALAAEKVKRPILKGKVFDVENKPLAGASIFVYDSPDIRRPVQFISTQTTPDGRFEMELDAGKYWVLARYKQGRYAIGPLILGDRSSGDPEIIELANGDVHEIDFIVADLMEAAKMRTKQPAGYLKITGRILDDRGNPVKMAYAIANRKDRVALIPNYISAWTEADGRFSLSVPPGEYYIGASTDFPPVQNLALPKKVNFSAEQSKIDIQIDRTEAQ